jgi:hypothetical protein
MLFLLCPQYFEEYKIMVHTITPKDQAKRILLITVTNPVNPRAEPDQIVNELSTIVGDVTGTFYIIYDIGNAGITFSDIISGITNFARQSSAFEKKMSEQGRMILVGAGTLLNVAAKAAARFSPDRPFPVFKTQEEAIDHAKTELAKQQ